MLLVQVKTIHIIFSFKSLIMNSFHPSSCSPHSDPSSTIGQTWLRRIFECDLNGLQLGDKLLLRTMRFFTTDGRFYSQNELPKLFRQRKTTFPTRPTVYQFGCVWVIRVIRFLRIWQPPRPLIGLKVQSTSNNTYCNFEGSSHPTSIQSVFEGFVNGLSCV